MTKETQRDRRSRKEAALADIDPPVPSADEEVLPVRMLRGYWPVPPAGGEDDGTDRVKLQPGEEADLPASEARRIVKLGIAERADDF